MSRPHRTALCSRCHAAPAASSHYWCRGCQNRAHQAWAAAQAGLTPHYRAYIRAWHTVRQRVYRGRITRAPCQSCGARAAPFITRPRLPYRFEWWCVPCRRRTYPDRHHTGAPMRSRGGKT